MPTNQKRHRCCNCGARRVSKYMTLKFHSRFAKYGHWMCKYATPMEFETCNGVQLL